MKIYIIEDEKYSCDAIADFLSEFGYSVNRSYLGLEALKQIENEFYDLVMTDFYLPDINGKELIEKIKKLRPETDIVLFSGQKDIIDSINALEIGIYDFLTKPIDLQKLVLLIDELKNKKKEIKKDPLDFLSFEDQKIIRIEDFFQENKFCLNGFQMGSVGIFSEKTNRIYKKIEKLQDYPEIPVLLEGPTGSGKEILAKYTHYQNKNMKGDFIGINCSLLDKELFNSELFGYEKGAFTGAVYSTKGKFELANNGSLFLDEIGELPLTLQAKLLKVLESKSFSRLGSTEVIQLNTRIVAATNIDIENEIEKNHFRKDLFYRLNVIHIHLPPLRERIEDIPILITAFLKEIGKEEKSFSNSAIEFLLKYSWPGNIRELRNIVERAVIMTTNKKIIERSDLENYLSFNEKKEISEPREDLTLKKYIGLKEKEYIERILKKYPTQKEVSQILDIDRTVLYRKIKKYGI